MLLRLLVISNPHYLPVPSDKNIDSAEHLHAESYKAISLIPDTVSTLKPDALLFKEASGAYRIAFPDFQMMGSQEVSQIVG